MPLETRVYQKKAVLNPSKILSQSFKDINASWFLARQLAERDIRSQYRQSYFGIIWAFITPITTAVVWIFLNQSGIINLTDTGIPYPVYAFSGTLIWAILIESINSPTASTNGARGILSKINFPKEALILSGIYKMFFNSLIKILLLMLFLLIYGVEFQRLLVLLPFALLAIVFFGTSLGLLITPFGMLYNDIAKIIALGMRFIMYASPVVYMVPKEGWTKTVMEINPLTPLVTVTRTIIVGGELEYLNYYFLVLAVSVPLFVFGLIFYRISIPIIVERLSA